eukprot:GHVU01155499.1.p1 GENE.GHVU01155499.1~~GHVU01155499.1.p1  ORF type:complete len:189 (+),score=5.54 GHVU01155499.1:29-595(+)
MTLTSLTTPATSAIVLVECVTTCVTLWCVYLSRPHPCLCWCFCTHIGVKMEKEWYYLRAGPDLTREQLVLSRIHISKQLSWTGVITEIRKHKDLPEDVRLMTRSEDKWVDIEARKDDIPSALNIIAIKGNGERENASRRASPRAGGRSRSPFIVWGVRKTNARTLHRIQMCFDADDTRDPEKPLSRAH